MIPTDIIQGIQMSEQYDAQASANKRSATALLQAGNTAANVAAANMATSQRQSAAALGEQAAAFAESGGGTGGTTAGVEKQAATNARMDQLNIWYGGELEKHQDYLAANEQRYQQLINKRSSGWGVALMQGGKFGGQLASMGSSYGGGSGTF